MVRGIEMNEWSIYLIAPCQFVGGSLRSEVRLFSFFIIGGG